MTIRFFVLLFVTLTTFACNTTKQVVNQPIPEVTVEERQLDTMVITAPKPNDLKRAEEYKLPRYNASYTRRNDLLHTKLELKFDWEKQQVLGLATLTLKPHFYPTDQLELDAKGFEIESIRFAGQKENLKYDYDQEILTIDLGRSFPAKEEYTLVIRYIAKPSESGLEQGGAITSDQGLFFINHDGKDPEKPMQIWTQGETEYNSRWFPTIDKPNERCTQETYVTVADKFKTLSNGTLVSSTKNADGTRTDYWKMDQAHAPYLFMLSIGEFAVAKENWRNIPLEYYVEPEYIDYAKEIFAHTPEMLDFFSEYTGVTYPWQKYSQVIVRDYVSGAMENTTGVIFGEFVQKTDRELIDNSNDMIVAHELFHHWFGDLVTCESWANLTMNEGFANYGEYLWSEYKYGKDAAEDHRRSELRGYLGSVNQGGAHPLIHFSHEDKEDMFDAHSYNKGGLVLHMLRQYVGDEAFRAGLKKYLTDNAYTAVEAHNLRLAFEAVTGEDLNWFFNQWFFNAGHPELDINYDYDASTQKVSVTIEQMQDPDKYPPIFQLPMAIDVYVGKRAKVRHDVVLNERKQTFTFDATEEPALVNVDADKYLLCEKRDNKSVANYIFQFYNAQNYLDRYEALIALRGNPDAKAKQVFDSALQDPHETMRAIALSEINPNSGEVLKTISKMAANDKHSEVRATALEILGASGAAEYTDQVKMALKKDRAYPVIAQALQTLQKLEPEAAMKHAKELEKEENGSVISAVGSIYAESGDLSKQGFFEQKMTKVDGPAVISFLGNYLSLVKQGDDANMTNSIMKLKTIATDMTQSPWRRFGVTKNLSDLRSEYREMAQGESDTAKSAQLEAKVNVITEMIEDIKTKETNEQLKAIYGNF